MNYLAHAYLSFGNKEILAGNMISDFIKGKKKFDYSENIQKGIALHHFIDEFTDAHEATKQAKLFFKPFVGLYAGAFVDVVYDHFLANDANEFTDESLKNFAGTIYNLLYQQQKDLPEIFVNMLGYMSSQNWLYNYKNLLGTENSFKGLARRAKFLKTSSEAFKSFAENYVPLKNIYQVFFPQLKQAAYNKFNNLLLQ